MTARVHAAAVLATLAATLTATIADAHHSVAAGFDMDREVAITGTITAMEFINPHARLSIEVAGADGSVETWTAWFTSANNLFRRGWRATDLPVGTTVTIKGFPARDGSSQTYGGETLLPDGRTLFGGNAPGQR